MKRKRLINEEFETFNEMGNKLRMEFFQAVSPIIKRWINDGYSTIDIENILTTELSIAERLDLLDLQSKIVKEKKKENSMCASKPLIV